MVVNNSMVPWGISPTDEIPLSDNASLLASKLLCFPDSIYFCPFISPHMEAPHDDDKNTKPQLSSRAAPQGTEGSRDAVSTS